mmetsp:Transcript_15131/g.59249  ORF Transcript_15131/g.59249 Transcript_15131/m.59249 type:complete len:436 (+) Transcript_15131:69-1376(+)
MLSVHAAKIPLYRCHSALEPALLLPDVHLVGDSHEYGHAAETQHHAGRDPRQDEVDACRRSSAGRVLVAGAIEQDAKGSQMVRVAAELVGFQSLGAVILALPLARRLVIESEASCVFVLVLLDEETELNRVVKVSHALPGGIEHSDVHNRRANTTSSEATVLRSSGVRTTTTLPSLLAGSCTVPTEVPSSDSIATAALPALIGTTSSATATLGSGDREATLVRVCDLVGVREGTLVGATTGGSTISAARLAERVLLNENTVVSDALSAADLLGDLLGDLVGECEPRAFCTLEPLADRDLLAVPLSEVLALALAVTVLLIEGVWLVVDAGVPAVCEAVRELVAVVVGTAVRVGLVVARGDSDGVPVGVPVDALEGLSGRCCVGGRARRGCRLAYRLGRRGRYTVRRRDRMRGRRCHAGPTRGCLGRSNRRSDESCL